MIFHELNRGKCKTYLVISEGTRKAAVIDPLRDKVEREEDEYRGELGHIAGARLIPLKELPERTGELANAKGRDIRRDMSSRGPKRHRRRDPHRFGLRASVES